MFENMTTEMWIGLVAFIAGFVLLFGSAYRKQVGWKINPVWSGVIGVVLVVFGGAIGVMPMLPDTTATTAVTVDTVSVPDYPPAFVLSATNGTTGVSNTTTVEINDAGTAATVLLEIGELSHDASGTHFGVNFTVKPVPPTGADADTLATIYFESPYDMTYSGEHVLAEDDGIYFANWTYAGGTSDEASEDYAGSMTMLMTETGYCEITYEIDDGADSFAEEVTDIGDSGSWDVTFHNEDWSWSEVFTLTWILIAH